MMVEEVVDGDAGASDGSGIVKASPAIDVARDLNGRVCDLKGVRSKWTLS